MNVLKTRINIAYYVVKVIQYQMLTLTFHLFHKLSVQQISFILKK